MGIPVIDNPETNARVLLIEDDPALGAVTTEVLTQLGHEVAWSTSARAAFTSLAHNHSFDAVLLDLGLGESDGVTLVTLLRNQGHELPPLLVFSAQPIDVLKRAARATGAVGILQKPCSATQLAAALERAMQ
jgi:two-component system, OmpR family, KDP operon response regulator KdpE